MSTGLEAEDEFEEDEDELGLEIEDPTEPDEGGWGFQPIPSSIHLSTRSLEGGQATSFTKQVPTKDVQSSLSSWAKNIAEGAVHVAKVSTLAILAASALVPIAVPLAAGQLTTAVVAGWIGGLGGNALATWLEQWSKSAIAPDKPIDDTVEQQLVIKLARDLQQQIVSNRDIANDIAELMKRTQLMETAMHELNANSNAQTRLIKDALNRDQSYVAQLLGRNDGLTHL